jgi:hypothetical protein
LTGSSTFARPVARSPKLGERDPQRRASDGQEKGKEKDLGEDGNSSPTSNSPTSTSTLAEQMRGSSGLVRKRVELRVADSPNESSDKGKGANRKEEYDQSESTSSTNTMTRENSAEDSANDDENNSGNERDSGLGDSSKSVDDATSAKRKFLKRSSSSNNSMTRKRLSTSGKSLRDINPRFSLASGGSSLSASGPVGTAADELTSASVAGINQIFYGKAELVKLLLELDEFD